MAYRIATLSVAKLAHVDEPDPSQVIPLGRGQHDRNGFILRAGVWPQMNFGLRNLPGCCSELGLEHAITRNRRAVPNDGAVEFDFQLDDLGWC
jgi:hypothetical protein